MKSSSPFGEKIASRQKKMARDFSEYEHNTELKMKLVISGNNILSFDVGACFTVHKSIDITAPELQTIISYFKLGHRIRLIPLETWQRDVDFHATTKSEPNSSSRIPIHFKLDSSIDKFVVESFLFNPMIHIGEGTIVSLSKALGLIEYSNNNDKEEEREKHIFGLTICGKSLDELENACKWINSEDGLQLIAEDKFTRKEC
jgi:hypothetical protein